MKQKKIPEKKKKLEDLKYYKEKFKFWDRFKKLTGPITKPLEAFQALKGMELTKK